MRNRQYFEPFIEEEDFDCYVLRKRINSEFADHLEIQVISTIYNRPVDIYRNINGKIGK